MTVSMSVLTPAIVCHFDCIRKMFKLYLFNQISFRRHRLFVAIDQKPMQAMNFYFWKNQVESSIDNDREILALSDILYERELFFFI